MPDDQCKWNAKIAKQSKVGSNDEKLFRIPCVIYSMNNLEAIKKV
jgi:hypothetical protein